MLLRQVDPKVTASVASITQDVEDFGESTVGLLSAYRRMPDVPPPRRRCVGPFATVLRIFRILPAVQLTDVEERWEKVYRSVFNVCRKSQVIDINAAGCNEDSFLPAEAILDKFVHCAEDFFSSIESMTIHRSERMQFILNEIQGVIKRVNMRMHALEGRRLKIPRYQEAMRRLLGE